MSPGNERCPQGVENKGRIDALEHWVKDMATDVKWIRDRLAGRPSWFIAAYVVGLSSLCAGLIIWAVTHA